MIGEAAVVSPESVRLFIYRYSLYDYIVYILIRSLAAHSKFKICGYEM